MNVRRWSGNRLKRACTVPWNEMNFFALQPKVDLKTEEITGVEALLRWPHPERGLLCPRQFISVAEDCGLMLPIGRWCSAKLADKRKPGKSRPASYHMAVNVSSIESQR